MEPISGMIHSPAAPAGVRETSIVQPPQREAPRTAAPVPATDQYVPEEAHTPCGLYWVGKDEDGSPRIFFDDPEPKTADTPPEDEKPLRRGDRKNRPPAEERRNAPVTPARWTGRSNS